MSVALCLIVLVPTLGYSVFLMPRLSILLAIIYHLFLELSAPLFRILLYNTTNIISDRYILALVEIGDWE
jgi:hypothetical protein